MRRLNRWLCPLVITCATGLSSQAVGAPASRPQPAPPKPPADHRLRLAYFVPKDRQPTPNYEQKIRVVMAIVADLYLDDLRAKKYQTEGLRFESGKGDGEHPAVLFIRGQRNAGYYNNAPR